MELEVKLVAEKVSLSIDSEGSKVNVSINGNVTDSSLNIDFTILVDNVEKRNERVISSGFVEVVGSFLAGS